MQELTVFNFNNNSDIDKWIITNDHVMGGLSSSRIELNKEGNGVFSGAISTDNNGGFAMTRLPLNIAGLGGRSKVVLKLKGDGKKFQFRIKASSSQKYWYIQVFQTSNNWQTIELPLNDFYASFRGYKLNKENFSSNKIEEIAILIGNKKEEDFKLEIAKITVK